MSSTPTHDTLRELIAVTLDCEQALERCARKTESRTVCEVCLDRALGFQRAAEDLSVCLMEEGVPPPDGGSLTARVRGWWRELRGRVSGRLTQELLNECTRLERDALQRYRRVLQQGDLPEPCDGVVAHHYHRTRRLNQKGRRWESTLDDFDTL